MTPVFDALLKEKLVTSEQINGARDKEAGLTSSFMKSSSILVFSGQ